MANDSCQVKKSETSRAEKTRIILGISIRILSFVNILANSFGVNARMAWKECNRRLYNYYRTLASAASG